MNNKNHFSEFEKNTSMGTGVSRSRIGVFFAQVQMVLLLVIPSVTFAEYQGSVSEYPAKAALLYNFAKFTTWPKSSFINTQQVFTIGWFGESVIGDGLKTIANKMIHGRRIKIINFNDIEDFEPCQILYANSDFLNRLSKKNPGLLNKLNVLTVGGESDFFKANGILLISVKNDRLAFSVNQKSAQRANIEISANLLSLATSINGE